MKTLAVTLFLCIAVLTSQLFSQKQEKDAYSTSLNSKVDVADELVYLHFFNLVINFENEAEKQVSEESRISYSDFIRNKSNVTIEQMTFLKVLSQNFVSSSSLLRANEKFRYALLYKDEIRKFFGENDFREFSEFLKSEISSSLKINFSKSTITSSSSNIGVSGNLLVGGASTVIQSLNRMSPPCPTSVSASISGPGVSVGGSGTCDANGNSFVSLSSMNFLPGSTYTITASHSGGGGPSITTASTTTPGASPSNVVSVDFQLIETDDLPIDSNPNTGNGFRIFPDDKAPNDPKNRRKIRVKAIYGQAVAGVDIYFEAFDMDDPSSDDPLIDPNEMNGYDNKDEIDSSGSFSIPIGANGCQVISAAGNNPLIKCMTNSVGEVFVDFTVSRQPGDNFSIAASTQPLELGQVTVSGPDLLKGNSQPVPIFCTTSNVCRTELLTIWRRLHIEVDSMGVVSENKVVGFVANTIPYKIGYNPTKILINSTPLERSRFKGGVLVSGIRKFRIVDNTTNDVTLTTLFGNTLNISPNENVTLYDNDDYNKSNGKNLIGDNGENITNPNYMFEALNPSLDLPGDNILAPAYIKPVYDAVDTRDDNVFHTNLPATDPNNINSSRDNIRSFFDKWDSFGTNTDRKYWSVYILGAYQPEITEDGDGEDGVVLGIVDEITDNNNSKEGSGALLFLEPIRQFPLFSTNRTDPSSTQVILAHELGHLFGCVHGELEIMGTSTRGVSLSNKFSLTSLNKIRRIKHP
jgi:hypothetical protein